jgi:hypothetical protein
MKVLYVHTAFQKDKMSIQSLQDLYASKSICFGCGPCNKQGLQIKSYAQGDLVIARWKPELYHHAFPGVLNGGIIGAILDCHSNWAAAWALRENEHPTTLPCTVTAEFSIKLRKPTPMDQYLDLTARCVKTEGNKVTISSNLTINDKLYASCDGIFVSVGPEHPAHHRW